MCYANQETTMSYTGNYAEVDALNWASVQPAVGELMAIPLSAETVGPWLQRWSDLTSVIMEANAQVYREVTENTADAAAEQRFNTFWEVTMPQWRTAAQALKQRLLDLEDYAPTAHTVMMMKRFRTEADIFRDENEPLLSQLKLLGNQYDKTVGSMTIEWQGRTETLPQAASHLEERDRGTRQAVWHLMMERYLAERQRLNDLYLEMLPLRRRVAQNAGLGNFRDYQWLASARFDYTPEDCFTFHDAIEHEVVPLASALYRQQAARLDIDEMRPWDEGVDPNGEPLKPFTDVAELEEGAYRIFRQVDPELAGHYVLMRDGFLDLASRPNKAPGGYCNDFAVSGRPYIFMNAVGTDDDVSTLLHEGGHAFHLMESMRQPLYFNYNGPMEFCEVASMAMELLSAPYLTRDRGGFYDEMDARRAHAGQLRKIVWFLPYMAVVDAFQHWVYTEAPTDVSAADLDATWSALWDRFMPGIDYRGLQTEKETGWHRKAHIFTDPFYYVEYGLAQLGALQVWRNAMADQAQAVAAYRAALVLGDTQPLPELFQAAGARFAFDRRTVGELMDLIHQQLEVLDG
jgi:oligoendopeptidase F